MTKRRVTIYMLIVVGCFLGVWAISAALNKTEGDEISVVLRDYGWQWPSIPFMLGGLFGHFFWVSNTHVPYRRWRWIPFLLIGAGSIWVDSLVDWSVMPVWPFLLGLPVGHYVWPQERPDGPAED